MSMNIRVKVNGQDRFILNGVTVGTLLESLGLEADSIAIAVNCTCIPRAQWQEHALREQDDIEVLSPMAGG